MNGTNEVSNTLLTGTITTNQNDDDHSSMLLTFSEAGNPEHIFTKSLDVPIHGQNQTITLNDDVGFAIDPSKQYVATLSYQGGEHQTIVTDVNFTGANISWSGNIHLSADSTGSNDTPAFTLQ